MFQPFVFVPPEKVYKTKILFSEILCCVGLYLGASLVAQSVSAYNVGDSGSIPGSGRSPEKEMATHSTTLAWKIPWTEKPGRLQSMGLHRVRHD